MLVHPLDDLVGDVAVGGVAPPDQDVGVGEHLFGETVLGLGERGRADDGPVAQVLGDPLGDRGVHAVGVDRRHVGLDLLVDVLAPDQDADRTRGTVGCGHGDSAF